MLTPTSARFLQRTVLNNPYVPHKPTGKQARFLLSLEPELLYGGAAGGGKSDALLMAALQFVEIPGYSAILFRRTFQDLSLPEALMDRAASWLSGTNAKWNGIEHQWLFPSGAKLTFGYLQTANDKYRYQSAAFQFIGFDELTQFEESSYAYLFSRLRRPEGSVIPLRMRAASNPGGIGHAWVRSRFVDSGKFIPAVFQENPHLDHASYEASLNMLDSVTRAQLKDGNWLVNPDGLMFKREWFSIVDDYPHDAAMVRYWDLAATVANGRNDPDWTSGCLMARKDGRYWIVDMAHSRSTPLGVQQLVAQKAAIDGKRCTVWLEQEPGSGGVNTVDHYRRNILAGYDFRADKVTGSKIERARPLSAAAEAGNVMLVRGSWNEGFLDEACSFPEGSHDDQIDAATGALSHVRTMFLVG
jgi:predicted phage terminase large subunit-like protein